MLPNTTRFREKKISTISTQQPKILTIFFAFATTVRFYKTYMRKKNYLWVDKIYPFVSCVPRPNGVDRGFPAVWMLWSRREQHSHMFNQHHKTSTPRSAIIAAINIITLEKKLIRSRSRTSQDLWPRLSCINIYIRRDAMYTHICSLSD